jgi:hypothetical protein
MIFITFTLSLLTYTLNALPISQVDGKAVSNDTHTLSLSCPSTVGCSSGNTTLQFTAIAPDHTTGSNWQSPASAVTLDGGAPQTDASVHITHAPISHTLGQGVAFPGGASDQGVTLTATHPTVALNGAPGNCGNPCVTTHTVQNLTVMPSVTIPDSDS